MIKEKKIHAQRLEQFNQAYGSIMMAHELVSKMSDGGKPEDFDLEQVRRLQVLTRSAACHANAMTATFDGQLSQ